MVVVNMYRWLNHCHQINQIIFMRFDISIQPRYYKVVMNPVIYTYLPLIVNSYTVIGIKYEHIIIIKFVDV